MMNKCNDMRRDTLAVVYLSTLHWGVRKVKCTISIECQYVVSMFAIKLPGRVTEPPYESFVRRDHTPPVMIGPILCSQLDSTPTPRAALSKSRLEAPKRVGMENTITQAHSILRSLIRPVRTNYDPTIATTHAHRIAFYISSPTRIHRCCRIFSCTTTRMACKVETRLIVHVSFV